MKVKTQEWILSMVQTKLRRFYKNFQHIVKASTEQPLPLEQQVLSPLAYAQNSSKIVFVSHTISIFFISL